MDRYLWYEYTNYSELELSTEAPPSTLDRKCSWNTFQKKIAEAKEFLEFQAFFSEPVQHTHIFASFSHKKPTWTLEVHFHFHYTKAGPHEAKMVSAKVVDEGLGV